MRYIDTNIFIRFLTGDVPSKEESTRLLFRRVDLNEEEVTTSEAVVAEIVYVLSSRSHYGLSRDAIHERLSPILNLEGLKLDRKSAVLRGLEIYADYPRFDFEDALSVAHMESMGIEEILSYDLDFDFFPGIKRIEP